tara:strand:+ start:440 stop:595 length:156 start_codon:yes stop_codon:yes gene_type:complete
MMVPDIDSILAVIADHTLEATALSCLLGANGEDWAYYVIDPLFYLCGMEGN